MPTTGYHSKSQSSYHRTFSFLYLSHYRPLTEDLQIRRNCIEIKNDTENEENDKENYEDNDEKNNEKNDEDNKEENDRQLLYYAERGLIVRTRDDTSSLTIKTGGRHYLAMKHLKICFSSYVQIASSPLAWRYIVSGYAAHRCCCGLREQPVVQAIGQKRKKWKERKESEETKERKQRIERKEREKRLK